MANSTWPTPGPRTSHRRRSPPSSRSWARRRPSTSAGPWHSGSSPARQMAFDLGGLGVDPRALRAVSKPAPHAPGRPLRAPRRGRPRGVGTARFEQGNQLITPGQVRDWCATTDQMTVKPVLDLEAHDPVDSPAVPDRHAEVAAVSDRTCVFPWCTRPARRCDTDHTTPAARGGSDLSVQSEAALCRRHHRIKTHGGWTYTDSRARHLPLDLPHGYPYLRDPDGTLDLTRGPPSPAPA